MWFAWAESSFLPEPSLYRQMYINQKKIFPWVLSAGQLNKAVFHVDKRNMPSKQGLIDKLPSSIFDAAVVLSRILLRFLVFQFSNYKNTYRTTVRLTVKLIFRHFSIPKLDGQTHPTENASEKTWNLQKVKLCHYTSKLTNKSVSQAQSSFDRFQLLVGDS